MTVFACTLTNYCCGRFKNQESTIDCGAIIFDALATITLLVVGILGITRVIPTLPPAASYSLIGVGSGIAGLYLLLIGAIVVAKLCCENQSSQQSGSRRQWSSQKQQ